MDEIVAGDRVEWPADPAWKAPKYQGTVRLTSPAWKVAIVDWDQDGQPGPIGPAGLVGYSTLQKMEG